jgi:hypothetical protein
MHRLNLFTSTIEKYILLHFIKKNKIMMGGKKYIAIVGLLLVFSACNEQMFKDVMNAAGSGASPVIKPLTNEEVINGLREALSVGTNNSTAFASKLDGFYKNELLFIAFPPEAIKVKNTLEDLGFKEQTDKFVLTLNRAAEEATKSAAPVFLDAIKGMTITDGFAILKGNDSAATSYLKEKTTAELKQKFTPIVQDAINKVELTKYWTPVISTYNNIPFVEKQNADLTGYVTDKAVFGLFKLIAQEELKIRQDPAARVTDVLKRVFGYNVQ